MLERKFLLTITYHVLVGIQGFFQVHKRWILQNEVVPVSGQYSNNNNVFEIFRPNFRQSIFSGYKTMAGILDPWNIIFKFLIWAVWHNPICYEKEDPASQMNSEEGFNNTYDDLYGALKYGTNWNAFGDPGILKTGTVVGHGAKLGLI